MNIVLYGRPYNRTDRVQWTLEELQLPYEYRKLDVWSYEHRKPEFKSKYGLTRLPFVEIDGRVLFESGAIMLFLAEAFRHKADILPINASPIYRDILQWLFFANSTLESSDETLPSNSKPSAFAPLIDTLSFLDETLAERQFIAGDRFTIADIAVANNLKWVSAQTRDNFPNVKRYFDMHTLRPAFVRMQAQAEYPK